MEFFVNWVDENFLSDSKTGDTVDTVDTVSLYTVVLPIVVYIYNQYTSDTLDTLSIPMEFLCYIAMVRKTCTCALLEDKKYGISKSQMFWKPKEGARMQLQVPVQLYYYI